ncbi:MAG: prepilin peptidase [Caldimicrobium sp.]
MKALAILFVFIFGLAIGSFLNVLIYRLPRGMSLLSPSSHCPHCKTKIKWYHNIPLLSFLFLKGRCAFCGEKISLQYPLVEILSAFLLVLIYLKFNPSEGVITFIFMSYLVLSLLSISFIDLRHKEIPDLLSIPLIFAGWILSLFGKNPFNLSIWESLISAFAGMGLLFFINELYYLIAKRESIGIGDFKLMGALGAFLGHQSFFNILFFASLFGVFAFVLVKFIKRSFDLKESLREEIPFGPFLSLGALTYLFNPQSLL